MNSFEREAHNLDALDALDSIMRDGLQGIAQLLGQNDPSAWSSEPATNARERSGLLGLFLWLRPQSR
jgi:hypothetical protein